MRYRLRVLAFACLLPLFAGCAAAKSTDSSAPAGPVNESFYQAPAPGPDAKPGKVIRTQRIAGGPGVIGLAILYWSTNVAGHPVAVSATLFRPQQVGPGASVVAWAHATTGLGDNCAPSRVRSDDVTPSSPIVAQVVGAGAVFVATDYEGLGTPGDHPYLVSQAAGRNVLDAVRAATALTGAGSQAPTVVLGQSQGGTAALFADELRQQYAPEVNLQGVVAVAPASQLEKLRVHVDGGPYAGYAFMTADGLLTGYPELKSAAAKLTSDGKTALQRIRTQCADEILQQFANSRQKQYGLDRFFTASITQSRLAKNDPGKTAPAAPLFIVHGNADDVVPVQSSQKLVKSYCAFKVPVFAKFYPAMGHLEVFQAATNDIAAFIKARLAGAPAESSCAS